MICDHSVRPSPYIILARKTFANQIRPGRIVTDVDIATVIAQLNTAVEMTIEYEDEMLVLESMMTPPARPAVSAEIIPLRRRPQLRVICGPNDGGDAA